MLESVSFLRKREKLAKNVDVKGENVNIFGENAIFELTTKKRPSEFLPGKPEVFPENPKFFRLESKMSATGFTTPDFEPV